MITPSAIGLLDTSRGRALTESLVCCDLRIMRTAPRLACYSTLRASTGSTDAARRAGK